ncbi:MAG: EAL domain-containing protein [Rhodospirillales bacterium]|nr:EAL domain-containing protein [Rhodospirillales bacterium]
MMAEAGYATGAYREPETSEEALLLARLKRVETNPAGVYAVHVHLSKLRPNNRQPHFLSIAQRSFDGLIESYEATVFPLSNADIVVICRNAPVDDTDAAVGKIRALFSEDPLLAGEKGGFEDPFSTWYDLSQPDDFSSFASVANQLAIEAQRTRQQQTTETKVKVEDKGRPLTAQNLPDINQKLQGTRVADLMREQTCLEMGPEGPGNIVFREHFILVADLKKRIAPDVNLFASPWLFQYLTETLDKRVLAVLANRGVEKATSPLSLNLNVNTILSRDFQNFHKVIDKNAKKVVIEMQVLDIFADMNTFVYARDLLQERGYRVLLDGLNPLALQFIEPGKLKTDFVKIAWGPEFEGGTDSGKMAQMREVVTATGKDSVILARVDTEQAVKWGIALGVKRFQGYYVDDLMKKIADVQIQKAKAQAAARAAQPVPPPQPVAAPAPVRTPAQAQPRPTTPARPTAPAQLAPARPVQPGQAQPRPPAPARPAQPGQVPPRPAQPGHMPQRPAAAPVQARPAQPGQVPPRPSQPGQVPPRPAAPAQPRPVAPGPGAPKR